MKGQRKGHSSDDVDSTSKLGFRIGANVALSVRFFRNHRLKYEDLGTGTVEGKKLPTAVDMPVIYVKFPYHKSFYGIPELQRMIVNSETNEGRVYVLIAIHPVYLEKRK